MPVKGLKSSLNWPVYLDTIYGILIEENVFRPPKSEIPCHAQSGTISVKKSSDRQQYGPHPFSDLFYEIQVDQPHVWVGAYFLIILLDVGFD
ncbi:hypothetical protein AYI69_g7809 [Smittium culicis]|uniref:Uncharacterized protein n=1 Tax=Smittium culicis TaxID=133412 RepID=A0A1R1XPJ4_9FUNG|nr:hypothetical protein AYI69_g7809 [Smittium culicis]